MKSGLDMFVVFEVKKEKKAAHPPLVLDLKSSGSHQVLKIVTASNE